MKETKLTILSQNLRTSGSQIGLRCERESGDHNLWHRARRLRTQVQAQDPDVILAQEGMPGSVAFFEEDPYFAKTYGAVYQGRGGEGILGERQSVPVLYKKEKYDLLDSGHFWLSETPDTDNIGHYNETNRYPRITTWVHLKDKETGVEFYCYSAHFDGTAPFPQKAMQQYIELFKKQKPGTYAFMAGDLNTRYRSPEYQAMMDWEVLVDLKDLALNTGAEIGGDTGTVHSRYSCNGEWAEGDVDHEPFGSLRQIDHIIAKREPHLAVDYWGVDYTQYGCPEEGIKDGYHSDHYGVLCKVRMDAKEDTTDAQAPNPRAPAL